MISSKIIESLVVQIVKVIPLKNMVNTEELQKKLRPVLHNAFEKMELVSREDFDHHAATLHQATIKIEQLEARITELEAQANQRKTD